MPLTIEKLIEHLQEAAAPPDCSDSTSQNAAILAHLKDGGTITSLSALQLCGTLRCSGRIYDLRKAGHDIKDRWIETPLGKKVKEYFLDKT